MKRMFLILITILAMASTSYAFTGSGIFSMVTNVEYFDYNSWNYHKCINVNTTSTGSNTSGNLSDFPLLIHINSSSFSANELTHFFASNTTCKRFRVYGSDLITILPYEIDRCTNGSEAVIWTKVPTVTGANANTGVVCLAYGNDPTSGDQNSTNGTVWNTDFKLVEHMNDTNTSTITDSTSNALSGAKFAENKPIEIDGYIGKGQDFIPANLSEISVTDTAVIDLGAYHSVFAWVKRDADGAHVILQKGDPHETKNSLSYMLIFNTVYDFGARVSDTGVYDSSHCRYYKTAQSSNSSGTWYRVGYTFAAGVLTLYQNGVVMTPTKAIDAAITTTYNSARPLYIGALEYNASFANYMDGIIDEIQLSSSTGTSGARSLDWIKLDYYNQKKTNYHGDGGVSAATITWGSE
jgi:hypothetical protein